MSSTSINGTLAEHVYGNGDIQLPSGFEVLTEWPSNDGYSGTAYINRTTREIVIAHRGTNQGTDWWSNLEHTFIKDFSDTIQHGVGNPISDQLRESEAFVKSIVGSPRFKDYSFSQTGHSLGGFIATINGAKFSTPVEAFDPPGHADYLGYLLDKKVLNDEQVGFLNQNLKTHISDGSAVDLLSSNNNYLGTLNHVQVKGSVFEVLKKHSMREINKSLGNNVVYMGDNLPSKKDYDANVFTRIHDLLDEIELKIQKLSLNLEI